MDACGHYRHWRKDFDLVEELGLKFLRYGPPLHTTLLGPEKYDWEFADVTFGELRKHGYTGLLALEIDYLHPDYESDERAIADSIGYMRSLL